MDEPFIVDAAPLVGPLEAICGRMKDAKDFDIFMPDTIRNDITRARDYQSSCSGHPSGPAQEWVFLQSFNRLILCLHNAG